MRDERRMKAAEAMLSRLREGMVIVEGKHDVPRMEELGIRAVTYYKAVTDSGAVGKGTIIYLLTDSDKGGEEKKGKLISALLERDKSLEIDTELGGRLLRMLNLTSIEQIGKPMAELLAKGGKTKKQNW